METLGKQESVGIRERWDLLDLEVDPVNGENGVLVVSQDLLASGVRRGTWVSRDFQDQQA